MRALLLLVTLCCLSPAALAQQTLSRESGKGFFSVGASYGLGAARLLNTDGGFADYKTSGFGLDLDILLWDAGSGDIRLFTRYQNFSGRSTEDTSDKMNSAETFFGVKVFVGSHYYLSGAWGQGQTNITSPSRETDMKLSYESMRAAMGIDLAITDSLFLGVEADYKSAPVRKNRNTSLRENTYLEGLSGNIHLIWSPPSVTIQLSSGK